MTEIRCNGCADTKPLADFERRPDSKFGYRRTCKECRRDGKLASSRKWYYANIDAERARARATRDANRERSNDRAFLWRCNNPEKVRENNRRYYLNNYEKILARNAKWRRFRYASLDYRWEDGVSDTNRIEVEMHQSIAPAIQIDVLFDSLTADEIEYCEAFMAGDVDEIPDFILSSIRESVI